MATSWRKNLQHGWLWIYRPCEWPDNYYVIDPRYYVTSTKRREPATRHCLFLKQLYYRHYRNWRERTWRHFSWTLKMQGSILCSSKFFNRFIEECKKSSICQESRFVPIRKGYSKYRLTWLWFCGPNQVFKELVNFWGNTRSVAIHSEIPGKVTPSLHSIMGSKEAVYHVPHKLILYALSIRRIKVRSAEGIIKTAPRLCL